MPTQAQLTGAPAPLILADGTEWRMSPLGEGDLSELNQWIKSQVMQTARAGLTDDMSARDREEWNRAAILAASQVSIETREGIQLLGTIDGWARVVWQATHRNHKGITVAEIRSKMLDPLNIKEAERIFTAQNVMENATKNQSGPALNRQERRAAQSKARR